MKHIEQRNMATPETSTESLVDQIGLQSFRAKQLLDSQAKLMHAIGIGMNRTTPPTTQDGGVPAIPSRIRPITSRDILSVPEGSEVFSAIFGGTNQKSGTTVRGRQDVYETTMNREPVPRNKKTLILGEFSYTIARHILTGVDHQESPRNTVRGIRAVGISLGIPQINTKNEYGIDARPLGQPSNWHFTDYDPKNEEASLGRTLVTYLYAQGLDVDKVVFQPDPTAVAHDVPYHDPTMDILPASILAGTGTNASLYGRSLELSTTTDIFPDDLVQQEMVERGFMPNQNLTKYRTGGHRIKLRVAAAMHVLAKKGQLPKTTADSVSIAMQDKQNGALLSLIASGDFAWNEFNRQYKTHLTPDDYETLRIVSRKALEQAGQVIGVMIASVATMAGYDGVSEAQIPSEGSVLKKGHGVMKKAMETVRTLLPQNQLDIHDASDLKGIGKLTLVHDHRTK